MLRRGIAPAMLVLGTAVVSWLLSGVSVSEVVRFLGYEGAFVALPGAALLWAVRGRREGALLTFAIGWPLGQALEILAFSATSALGVRSLYVFYPVVAIAACAPIIFRRRAVAAAVQGAEVLSQATLWAAAGVISIGLVYLTLLFIPQAPLPSTNVAVAYNSDFPFFIGLVAEVMHHWPATSPGLSGSPLHYEWFVFFHMAAVSQVTHVAVPSIALRLDYLPTIIVVGYQLLALGRCIGRAAWTGVIAIAVVFLLGPLDLTTDAGGSSPFFDLFSAHLWASWTFPFGLTFFLALLLLIAERLAAPSWRWRGDLGSWTLIALLMVGASGAKATILPVIIAGTGLYAAIVLLCRHKVPASSLVTIGLALVIFAITFVVVYGGGVPGTTIQPLVALARTAPVIFATGIANSGLREALLPVAYIAGLAGMLLPLAGMLYMLSGRHRRDIPAFALPLCMLAAALVITSVVHQLGYSELYFQDTGYVAGCIVAAAALRMAWLDAGGALAFSKRTLALALVGWVFLLIAAVALTSRTLAHPDALLARYAGLAAGAIVFVLAGASVLKALRRPASGVLALGLIPLLAAALLTSPIEVAPTVRRLLTGVSITQFQAGPQSGWGLTPGVLAALRWLSAHSSNNAVVAVSNHWINPSKTDGRNYYYSAFSDRQVFVEAYDPIRYGITTGLATSSGRDFAYRMRINDAVFNHGDVAALRIMTAKYGVRYLFIDQVHGGADPAVLQLGRVVYSDEDATVVVVG